MEKKQTRSFFDQTAPQRETWIRRSRYYHEEIRSFVASNISPENSILEIGSGLGDLVASFKSRFAVGVDSSQRLTELAAKRHPACHFMAGDAEELPLKYPFDYIILSDTIGLLPDVQIVFRQLGQVTKRNSRVIITYYNYLWEPILKLLETLGLKMPQPEQNWLPLEDVQNLLYLSGFEVIKRGYRIILPISIPLLSKFINRFVAKLPLIQKLCLVEWIIAKPMAEPKEVHSVSTSVIIPCRNERGNIAEAVRRTPPMGHTTELIFVDGASTDGTIEEIERIQREYPDKKILLIHQGAAKGKCDAVMKGFDAATGDALMILDADLTVPPEDLPKFFNALVEGKGEFINGSRLIYPMEKQAMRFLNLLGNKFFGMAFSYLLEQRFTDTLCGTKVLWREDYEKIKRGRFYFGDFDPFGDFYLLFGASKQNLKIVELPIRYCERTYGTTKIRRFAHGWLLMKMCWVAMWKLKFV